jgi:hypothetical protein
MVAIGPDGAFSAERPVYGEGEADRETADACRELATIVPFYNRVDVIGLD